MVKILKSKCRELWGKEEKITINKEKYRVGKMSYGEYFLEKGKPMGEREPFNAETLWGSETEITERGVEIIFE